VAVWDDVLGGINTVWSAKSHVEAAQDGNVDPVVNGITTASDGIGLTQLAATVANKAAPSLIPKCPQTPIIQAGLLAIAAMNLECGIGTPDSGDRFGNGSKEFNTVGQILESAAPTQNWQGSASSAYAAQDVKQQDRSQLMAKADSMIAGIVQQQASQVTNARTMLDTCSVALGVMVAPAMAAYPIPVVGPEISMGIQIGAVAGSMPIAMATMAKLATAAAKNGLEVAKATRIYNQVAATTP
jgi:hypothetical protein